MELSLRIAEVSGGGGCPLCGCWIDYDAGPVVTLAQSWAAVCIPCGLRHEPALVVGESLIRATESLQDWVAQVKDLDQN